MKSQKKGELSPPEFKSPLKDKIVDLEQEIEKIDMGLTKIRKVFADIEQEEEADENLTSGLENILSDLRSKNQNLEMLLSEKVDNSNSRNGFFLNDDVCQICFMKFENIVECCKHIYHNHTFESELESLSSKQFVVMLLEMRSGRLRDKVEENNTPREKEPKEEEKIERVMETVNSQEQIDLEKKALEEYKDEIDIMDNWMKVRDELREERKRKDIERKKRAEEKSKNPEQVPPEKNANGETIVKREVILISPKDPSKKKRKRKRKSKSRTKKREKEGNAYKGDFSTGIVTLFEKVSKAVKEVKKEASSGMMTPEDIRDHSENVISLITPESKRKKNHGKSMSPVTKDGETEKKRKKRGQKRRSRTTIDEGKSSTKKEKSHKRKKRRSKKIEGDQNEGENVVVVESEPVRESIALKPRTKKKSLVRKKRTKLKAMFRGKRTLVYVTDKYVQIGEEKDTRIYFKNLGNKESVSEQQPKEIGDEERMSYYQLVDAKTNSSYRMGFSSNSAKAFEKRMKEYVTS